MLRARSAEVRQQSALMVEGVAEGLVTVRWSGRTPGDHGDRFELSLGRVPQAVRVVRSDVRSWLERNGIAEAVTVDVVLACSEACANAVQHPENLTRQAFEVEARWDGDDLVLCVRDLGRWSSSG